MTTITVTGLTDAEVAQRVAEGKTNDVPTRAARSISEIVRGNRSEEHTSELQSH